MAKEITDLHGNKFRAGDYSLCTEVPIGKGNLIFTWDYVSGESFLLSIRKNKYLGYFYNQSLDLYIRYRLEYIGYEESSDIRKSHLYGKRR